MPRSGVLYQKTSNQVNLVLAPAGRNVYRPRSIPNSSPSGAECVYGHMLSDTCHPAGVQETVGHRFLYTCRTAGANM